MQSEASALLEEVQFQQTFSSGWSGGLKLPVGLEAGLTGTATLARQQMSLPDIVGRLRDFLMTVATPPGLVMIGIDELGRSNLQIMRVSS
jgi:hypothetical protein